MVHRKRLARKKPRDSVVVSKNGLVGDRARGGRDPGGGGGGFPRYTRATSSSDARAGKAVGGEATAAVIPAAAAQKRKPVRAEVVFAGKPYVSRATCSSVMKAAGFTAAAPHVCPYSFCSLKGHAHAPAVPLRSLVASQRRLIKTQQSMKLKGASPFRKTNNAAAGDGFFVEIYAGAGATAPTVSSDVCCSDLSTEEADATTARRMEYATFDHRSYGDDEDKAKGSDAASVDGSCGSSDVISGGSVEFLGTKSRGFVKQETDEEEKAYMDQEAEDFGGCKSDISEELDAKYEEGFSEDGGNGSKPSIDDITCALGGMNFRDECCDLTVATSCQRNKLSTSRRRRTPEEAERMRRFNPRAPNFLPVEPDPEAEKVDLKHQMMGDRKNDEEWMVDYALRRAVNKLARAQKRKVEMLVQAFETFLPPAANEKKPAPNDDDKKTFTITSSLQECS